MVGFDFFPKEPVVTVVGMGYIGLPTAVLFAAANLDVIGFDIDEKTIKQLQAGNITIMEPGLQEIFSQALNEKKITIKNKLGTSDVFIICVPTPFSLQPDGSKVADLSFVERASVMVGAYLKKGDVVVLESTVPPGTTEEVMGPLLEKCSNLKLINEDFYIAHCPERVLPGNMIMELHENDRIIGSSNAKVCDFLKYIYGKIVTKGHIWITDTKTAELCKLAENTYRDINIAYANELSMICDELDIDVWQLIKLANRHPRVNIMNPGPGVGGHCLAVDPWFIVERVPEKSQLIRKAREINEYKPEWIVDKIEKILKINAEHPSDVLIAILGLAYKADIDDLRESPSVHIAHKLQERGYSIIACEPSIPILDKYKEIPIVTLAEAKNKADFFVYSVNHACFEGFGRGIDKNKILDITGSINFS